ncbi:hypothetical protein PYCCODRAFT_1435172 [Trametes coccinea BRFM310]|uniref:RING-type domain-containing protein n=1 Tax=Trametes coccinea (strain BRFM310) TaxID=1353009 RepID=A0A1Y2IP42_TRAC3|nr:hypothetical protein PYCCODRAFT_1435172 [Trametes coccinea BRFM310]
MGNSASSGRGHHEEMVDFGYLTPQGIYTGPRDWNQAVVTQLIVDRKLAPFYRPLEDYDDSWDDEQILAARKEPQDADSGESSRAESISSSSTIRGHQKRPSAVKEPTRHPEAAIYRGAVECPICFLYYPPNINRSRCCDQAICTECFVQIKRADPTTTHLVSEPASCPYCVQENFGIVYTPPSWRAGIGAEGATPPSWPDSPKAASQQSLDAASNPGMKRRRKSFGANDPEVVTVDMIHPDWEAKLAAVRAAVARRANRRIIMRQVGDRLIPVGVTSGRVHPIPAEEGGAETPEGSSDRGSRRSRRRQQNQEINQFLGSMGLGGQDLEELMVMEAMRLSLLEHEAQQRRQQEEEAKRKREEEAAAAADGTGAAPAAASSTDSALSSQPTSNASSPSSLQPQPGTAIADSVTPSPSLPPVSPSPAPSGLLSPTSAASESQQSGHPSGRSTPSLQHEVTDTASSNAVPAITSDSEGPAATAEPQAVSALTADSHSRPRTPVSSSVNPDSAPPTEPPSSSEQTPDIPPALPRLQRPPSFSALAASSYDVLPSSPDSTISSKPLLERAMASSASASAAEGDSSAAAKS